MASIFSHALVAFAGNRILPAGVRGTQLMLLGIFCSCIPDADVLGFSLGVPYESLWGHRGFFHSFFFNLLLAFILTLIFFRRSRQRPAIILFLFACGASHGLLDAMTSGGEGIAFFAPFSNERYFLPWRPIQVSPIGVGKFLSEWGVRVIKSELYWIGIPALAAIILKLGTEKLARVPKN